jgi:hypothetical protein
MINEKDKKTLEWEINAALENVACLGRDAYGEYINKMTTYLMNKIHQADLKSDLNAVASPYFSKALEDLKDFAYDNCQPHNSDRLAEIVERL